MYLNGLCLSTFAWGHYDARAMDTVQTGALTDGWTDLVLHTDDEAIKEHGWSDDRYIRTCNQGRPSYVVNDARCVIEVEATEDFQIFSRFPSM